MQQGYKREAIYLIVPWSRRHFFSRRYLFTQDCYWMRKRSCDLCFYVNIKSHDEVLSLKPFRGPPSPPPHGCFQSSCIQFVPPSVLPVLFYVDYLLMLILLSMCSFGLLLHRDCFFFWPPSYHPQQHTPPPPHSFPHPLPCSPFWVTWVLFWRFLTPQKLSAAPFLPMSGTHNRERAPAERFSSH